MKSAAVAVLFLVLLFPAISARGDVPEPSRIPSLISSVRIHSPLNFCSEAVPLNQPSVRERMEKELLLTLWDRPQVILWLKRSRRYFPLIETMLAEHRLPRDLRYISLIESALRPHVGSPKGAMGFWQFMPETARNFGLTVNRDIDERRNIYAATRGAINYFKTLRHTFGSWTLAAAAYNMGEQGLEADILSQGTDHYYDLYLPLETQRYVFRILSAKLILSSPQTYGFSLTPKDYYQPIETDPVDIQLEKDTPIQLIAAAAETTFKTIKELNPEIRGYHLLPGSRTLLVPRGASHGFQKRLTVQLARLAENHQERVYIVKEGENLSTISKRFKVPLPALLIWNGLNPINPIHPGDRLIIAPPVVKPVR